MPTSTRALPKQNRKAQIVGAAEQLLREKGLVGVTTRAIAAAVPCSEGAIYVHFASRLELLLAVLEVSLPDMLIPLRALEEQIGIHTPLQNLTRATEGLERFHRRVTPMLASLFAEPELLQRFRETMAAKHKGPAGGIGRIARYIKAEQELGRVKVDIDADLTATTLMSVSFFRAFTAALLGQDIQSTTARRLVKSLL